ncbi:hypothetical protein WISP_122624 [Willisornis vidua]|uniref:Uncharacterized protein n=1 Tax=Willisornis vidua TaxID=1566151 RepID=A0ABQ9CS17_9PASS|nr:hypothetical protein WISP_122624 [Willisornis vidua]
MTVAVWWRVVVSSCRGFGPPLDPSSAPRGLLTPRYAPPGPGSAVPAGPLKSMGPAGIHARILEELADAITEDLLMIFEGSWETGEVPADWKMANVPIFKNAKKQKQQACQSHFSAWILLDKMSSTQLDKHTSCGGYEVSRTKAFLELNLMKRVNCKRIDFFTDISSRMKLRYNMEVLLKEEGDFITKDMEKAKVAFATFTLVFTDKTYLQKFQNNKNLFKERLNKVELHKPLKHGGIHPCMLRELPHVIARAILISLESL